MDSSFGRPPFQNHLPADKNKRPAPINQLPAKSLILKDLGETPEKQAENTI